MTSPAFPASPSPRTAQQEQALAIYLNDHLAGATGGLELAKRAAAAEQGSPLGPPLAALAAQIAADREALRTVMSRLRVRVQTYKVGAGWAAEKVGRLKLNGSWLSRTQLAPVLETEGLALGIAGKAALWRALRTLAESDERLDAAELDQLLARAADQADVVERLRRQAAPRRSAARCDAARQAARAVNPPTPGVRGKFAGTNVEDATFTGCRTRPAPPRRTDDPPPPAVPPRREPRR